MVIMNNFYPNSFCIDVAALHFPPVNQTVWPWHFLCVAIFLFLQAHWLSLLMLTVHWSFFFFLPSQNVCQTIFSCKRWARHCAARVKAFIYEMCSNGSLLWMLLCHICQASPATWRSAGAQHTHLDTQHLTLNIDHGAVEWPLLWHAAEQMIIKSNRTTVN